MIRKLTAISVLALASVLAGSSLAAATATAATLTHPKGWFRIGRLNEGAYCASATPRMGVTVARDDVNWDCTLTVQWPEPPGSMRVYKYQITQTDVCKWEYPAHATRVKAIDTTATPPAFGWACYIPVF